MNDEFKVGNLSKIIDEIDLLSMFIENKDYSELKSEYHTKNIWLNTAISIMRFNIWILCKIKIKLQYNDKKNDVLMYAGTNNQLAVLLKIQNTFLARKMQSVLLTNCKSKAPNVNEVIRIAITPIEFLKFNYLLFKRRKQLIRFVKEGHNGLQRQFLKAQLYTLIFHKRITSIKPKLVFMANDHNPENRALLRVAQLLRIKTAYVQHASVSDIFPPLEFDLAFLDGEISREKYRIGHNEPGHSLRQKTYLSGNLRVHHRPTLETAKYIGITINKLYSPEKLNEIVEELSKNGKSVLIRWHPGSSSKLKKFLQTEYLSEKVEFSDPQKENINDFCNRCISVIGGNTGALLDVVISRTTAIYAPFLDHLLMTEDTYGFYKNRIVLRATNTSEIAILINEINLPKPSSVRRFSASFRTSYEGQEDCFIVSKTIEVLNW